MTDTNTATITFNVERETPVMRRVREWQEFSARVNGVEARGRDDDKTDRLTDEIDEYVSRIIAEPSESPRDTALKLFALTQEYQSISEHPAAHQAVAEVRHLLA